MSHDVEFGSSISSSSSAWITVWTTTTWLSKLTFLFRCFPADVVCGGGGGCGKRDVDKGGNGMDAKDFWGEEEKEETGPRRGGNLWERIGDKLEPGGGRLWRHTYISVSPIQVIYIIYTHMTLTCECVGLMVWFALVVDNCMPMSFRRSTFVESSRIAMHPLLPWQHARGCYRIGQASLPSL